jgi:DNA-binding transcriptional ArsR family regulator
MEEVTILLKAFANTNRLKVTCALYKGEKNVRELEVLLGFPQSCISQHLAFLRKHDLVKVRRYGNERSYSLMEYPAVDIRRTLKAIYPALTKYCSLVARNHAARLHGARGVFYQRDAHSSIRSTEREII